MNIFDINYSPKDTKRYQRNEINESIQKLKEQLANHTRDGGHNIMVRPHD